MTHHQHHPTCPPFVPQGSLARDDLMQVFTELNHYKEIAYISEARARLLFAALDSSGDDSVSLAEFHDLITLIKVRAPRCAPRTTFT
eukprot:412750-Prymnesium_polylepis.1